MSIPFLNTEAFRSKKIIAVISYRSLGKTVLIKNIIYNLRHYFDGGIAIVNGYVIRNGCLRDCVAEDCTLDRINRIIENGSVVAWFAATSDIVSQVVAKQVQLYQQGIRKKIYIYIDKGRDEEKLFTDEFLDMCFKHDVHFILECQYIADLRPPVRRRVELVMTRAYIDKFVIEKFFDEFFGVFDDVLHLINAFSESRKNWSWLCIDRTATQTSIQECVGWYRATTSIPKFEIQQYNPLTAGGLLEKIQEQKEKMHEQKSLTEIDFVFEE